MLAHPYTNAMSLVEALDVHQTISARTAKVYPTEMENLRHAAYGLLTEAGEYHTDIKRVLIYGKEMTPKMHEGLVKELGDFMWYAALWARTKGLKLSDHVELGDGDTQALEAMSLGDQVALSMSASASLALTALANAEFDAEFDPADLLMTCNFAFDKACQYLQVTPAYVLSVNNQKLIERFPDGYSDFMAEARLDTGGLDAHAS